MFFKVKYMVFLLMKIPDMVLNMVIIISGFWAGVVILPLSEVGPVIGVLVPIAIHILKYFDERKGKRTQLQMELRLQEVEKEKTALREQLEKFEAERGNFRAEVRDAVADIAAKVENK